MSIITDALKKAQQAREKKHREAGDQTANLSPESDMQPRQPGKGGTSYNMRFILPAVVFGAILLVGIILTLLLFSRAKDPAPAKPAAARIAQIKPAQKKETKTATEETTAVKTSESIEQFPLNEPKEPFYFSTPVEDLPVLTGIMYSPTYPQAVIDGAMVSENEVVNGYTINQILPDKVKVSSKGKEFELRLR